MHLPAWWRRGRAQLLRCALCTVSDETERDVRCICRPRVWSFPLELSALTPSCSRAAFLTRGMPAVHAQTARRSSGRKVADRLVHAFTNVGGFCRCAWTQQRLQQVSEYY